MYVLVRTVHLFSGLVLAGGLFMYAATGFIMAHQDWFPGGESEKTTEQLTSEVAVRMGGGELPQEQADHWQRHLTGERACTADRASGGGPTTGPGPLSTADPGPTRSCACVQGIDPSR